MLERPPPSLASQVSIAVICALAEEGNAVDKFFDKTWEPQQLDFFYPVNNLTLGAMGHHYVVLSWMGGMGKIAASRAAERLVAYFPGIRLVLVVGVCGGTHRDEDNDNEIHLGDVVISKGIIPYDSGKIEQGGYRQRDNVLKPDATELSGLLNKLECSTDGRKGLVESAQSHLQAALNKKDFYALQSMKKQDPEAHFGFVASGDTVIKTAEFRDKIVNQSSNKPISFEMESSAVGIVYPGRVIVIKGFCDYADENKNKHWQRYAALTSAAYMRAFLDKWAPTPKVTGLPKLLQSESQGPFKLRA